MADEDPTDEARAVAMTAAAAAARVTETLVREAQNRRTEQQREAERQADRAQREAQAAARTQRASGPDFVANGKAEGDRRSSDKPPATSAQAAAYVAAQEARRQELEQAKAWATPERRREFEHEHMGSDSAEGWDRANGRLLDEWKEATGQSQPKGKRLEDLNPDERATADRLLAEASGTKAPDYDSAERRAATDQAMRDAGVPDSTRHARNISDQMNGKDPAGAAAADKAPRTRARQPVRTALRERGR